MKPAKKSSTTSRTDKGTVAISTKSTPAPVKKVPGNQLKQGSPAVTAGVKNTRGKKA